MGDGPDPYDDLSSRREATTAAAVSASNPFRLCPARFWVLRQRVRATPCLVAAAISARADWRSPEAVPARYGWVDQLKLIEYSPIVESIVYTPSFNRIHPNTSTSMSEEEEAISSIRVRVNGERQRLAVKPGETLMASLRREGHYSVKNGCDEGVCGACNVIMGERGLTRSCLVPAASCDGEAVMTVDGLVDDDGELHPLQEEFLERGAAQCGFCIPGVLLAAYDLLERNDDPTEDEVADALSGNICRCTGYVQQIEAIQAAAERLSRSDSRRGRHVR